MLFPLYPTLTELTGRDGVVVEETRERRKAVVEKTRAKEVSDHLTSIATAMITQQTTGRSAPTLSPTAAVLEEDSVRNVTPPGLASACAVAPRGTQWPSAADPGVTQQKAREEQRPRPRLSPRLLVRNLVRTMRI
eukprot:3797248-Amphidinium_carterae.1